MGRFTERLGKKGIPRAFDIHLLVDETLIQNIVLGVHKQYSVKANTLEIARFMDESSAHEYIKFLASTNFSCFHKTIQGKSLMEQIFVLGEGEKLAPEIKNGKEIILRSLDQPSDNKPD